MTHEFAFDITMRAAIRVNAPDEATAREMLAKALDCADSNFGAWPNGDPVTGEASLDEIVCLYEVDGEATGDC